MPKGWKTSFNSGNVSRIAQVTIDHLSRVADIEIDQKILNDKDIPEGCKVFMVFHEYGHLIHGPDERACDEFAFYHALRAGVSPFLCYAAIGAFMPAHYEYRVDHLENLLLDNSYLQNMSDENYRFSA